MTAPAALRGLRRAEPHRGLGAWALALLVATPGCLLIPRIDRHGMEALEAGHTMVGAWLGVWPTDRVPAVGDFERQTGVRPDLVDVYLDWFTPFDNVSHTVRHIQSKGAIPILTWEAHAYTTRDILDGTKSVPLRDGRLMTVDAYLEDFSQGTCRAARQAREPVLLRVLHEMNGGWFWWGISFKAPDGSRPNTNETYRAAWIKIHDAFTSKCGDLVRFVWTVNHASVGPGATFTGPYPGDAYVDFVGIDGYNWGANAPWGWQTFDRLFREAYCNVTSAAKRPLLINEVASTERGGDKADWIRDMFRDLDRYDRIQGFVWFNDEKYERETRLDIDWPIDSSPAALEAFAKGVRELAARRDADATLDPAGGGVGC